MYDLVVAATLVCILLTIGLLYKGKSI
jgi:hypothetical protein